MCERLVRGPARPVWTRITSSPRSCWQARQMRSTQHGRAVGPGVAGAHHRRAGRMPTEPRLHATDSALVGHPAQSRWSPEVSAG